MIYYSAYLIDIFADTAAMTSPGVHHYIRRPKLRIFVHIVEVVFIPRCMATRKSKSIS